jgi:hypothetical protein
VGWVCWVGIADSFNRLELLRVRSIATVTVGVVILLLFFLTDDHRCTQGGIYRA